MFFINLMGVQSSHLYQNNFNKLHFFPDTVKSAFQWCLISLKTCICTKYTHAYDMNAQKSNQWTESSLCVNVCALCARACDNARPSIYTQNTLNTLDFSHTSTHLLFDLMPISLIMHLNHLQFRLRSHRCGKLPCSL